MKLVGAYSICMVTFEPSPVMLLVMLQPTTLGTPRVVVVVLVVVVVVVLVVVVVVIGPVTGLMSATM